MKIYKIFQAQKIIYSPHKIFQKQMSFMVETFCGTKFLLIPSYKTNP